MESSSLDIVKSTPEGHQDSENRATFYMRDHPPLSLTYEESPGLQKTLEVELYEVNLSSMGLFTPIQHTLKVDSAVRIGIQNSNHRIQGIISEIKPVRFSGITGNLIYIKVMNLAGTITRSPRFKSNGDIPLIGYTNHPIRSSYVGVFQIEDISVSGIAISLESIQDIIFPGIEFHLNVFVLKRSTFKLHLRCLNVRKKKNKVIMGCEFIKVPYDFLKEVPGYLLAFSQPSVSVRDLRDSGFYVDPSLALAISSQYVSSNEDWNNYLKLRLSAQQHEGRWLNETNHKNTVDHFDQYARHMMVFSGSKLVAIGRIVFNEGMEERMEHNSLCKIPINIKNEGFIEASRFATHKDFRRTTIFARLMLTGFKISLQTNTNWVLANCEDSLVKIYKRFGAKSLDQKFTTDFMEGKNLNLLAFDIKNLYKGHNIKFINWYFIFDSLIEIDPTNYKNIRLSYRVRRNILNFFKKISQPYIEWAGLKLVKQSRSKFLETKGLTKDVT